MIWKIKVFTRNKKKESILKKKKVTISKTHLNTANYPYWLEKHKHKRL